MEHLVRPAERNLSPSPLRVRLLDDLHDGYAKTSFFDYPALRGITMSQLLAGDFPTEERHRAAAIAQNWLFFGLLEEVYGIAILSAEFLTVDDSGVKFLSTENLNHYADGWNQRTASLSEEEKLQLSTRLEAAFRTYTRFFQLYFASLAPKYPEGFDAHLNCLAVLFETLQLHKNLALGIGARDEPLRSNFSSTATAHLVRQGWCPYTLANLVTTMGSPCCFAFAMQFRDFPPFLTQDHSVCTPVSCAASNVDTATYKTQHCSLFCDKDGGCPTLFPALERIEASLNSNTIPIVSMTHDSQLAVTDDLQHPYVAISHVWADGMGSTSEEGLPCCQVQFLLESATLAYNYLNETDEEMVRFWVDSVCVPKRQDLRHKAIVLMSESYAKASAVIVIDKMLLEVSVEDPVEEQLFVLFISNWAQRMWTLPEALLSKQLLFRFRDGLVDFRTYFSNDVVGTHAKNPVGRKLLGWFGQLMITPFARSVGYSFPVSLDLLALQLSKRTSSRPEDEILAIAGIFGLQVRDYLPLDGDRRMAKFLREYNASRVPFDVLFLDGPKLALKNYTWAPKSFMKRQLGIELVGSSEEVWSIATTEGLICTECYCLHLQQRWPKGMSLRDYRLEVGTKEILVVIHDRNDPLNDGSNPPYDYIVLPQPVGKGEEFRAAICQSDGTVTAEAGSKGTPMQLIGYVHVFNEDNNKEWNQLPVANTAYTVENPRLVIK